MIVALSRCTCFWHFYATRFLNIRQLCKHFLIDSFIHFLLFEITPQCRFRNWKEIIWCQWHHLIFDTFLLYQYQAKMNANVPCHLFHHTDRAEDLYCKPCQTLWLAIYQMEFLLLLFNHNHKKVLLCYFFTQKYFLFCYM